MNVDRLRIDGRELTVDYSSLEEHFRIATYEEAEPELYLSAATLACLGLLVLGVAVEHAAFREITFSYGDEAGSRVAYQIPTLVGDPARLSGPKIVSAWRRDPESLEIIFDDPRNQYNRAVLRFVALAKEFIKGKRLQMSLPFPEEFEAAQEPAAEEEEPEGGKVLEFAGAAAT